MTSTATATRHSSSSGLLEGHRVRILASHDADLRVTLGPEWAGYWPAD